MTTCSGCGAVLATGLETFVGIGQAYCFDCWQEEQQLECQRELLAPELRDMRRQIELCEGEWKDAIIDHNYNEQRRLGAIIEAAASRVEDLEDELACLTVAYQRRHSVIGRAAA